MLQTLKEPRPTPPRPSTAAVLQDFISKRPLFFGADALPVKFVVQFVQRAASLREEFTEADMCYSGYEGEDEEKGEPLATNSKKLRASSPAATTRQPRRHGIDGGCSDHDHRFDAMRILRKRSDKAHGALLVHEDATHPRVPDEEVKRLRAESVIKKGNHKGAEGEEVDRTHPFRNRMDI
jgi:hypothetical protein